MEMYSTGKFSLLLTLGEHGVITVITVITVHEGETGAEYSLSSDSCFQMILGTLECKTPRKLDFVFWSDDPGFVGNQYAERH